MRSIEWAGGDIVVIDQTLLPQREEFLIVSSTEALAEAIVSLRVRGAPALGIAGAMGVAQAALRAPSGRVMADSEAAGAVLNATRPTAVNLGWAIDRVCARARAAAAWASEQELRELIVEEALLIQAEDEAACLAMAKHAQEFFVPGATVLTHCNTGFLCTGGCGTALGAIRYAHESGLDVRVLATETRPLLQGARLTVWELGKFGIPHELVVDGAAPGLIARGATSLVIVGADRVAANGDVANKVGTYPLALAAQAAGVPFVVVAPTSTIDLAIADGSQIHVEERPASEVIAVRGIPTAPEQTSARNPAFDITPSSLVTAIVTEDGVARRPFRPALARFKN